MRTTVPDATRRFGAALSFASTALLAVLVASVLSLIPLASCVPERGTIGAVIAQDDESGRLFLREVPEDLAAARANLKVGDEILLIDGLDVRFMDAKQINGALVGDVDSTVKLTLIRDEQVLRVTLKRTQARKLLNRSKKPVATSP